MFFFKLISNCCISFHSWAIIDNAMELRLLLPVAPCHLVLLLGHLLRSLGPRRAQLVDVVPIGAAPWSKTVRITRWRHYRQPLLTNTYTLFIKRYESYSIIYYIYSEHQMLYTAHPSRLGTGTSAPSWTGTSGPWSLRCIWIDTAMLFVTFVVATKYLWSSNIFTCTLTLRWTDSRDTCLRWDNTSE